MINAIMEKIILPVIDNNSPIPSTFLMFFISLFPQYCDANTTVPLNIQNINNIKKKKYLFANPTPAMAVSPNFPIITVSTKLTIIFKNV